MTNEAKWEATSPDTWAWNGYRINRTKGHFIAISPGGQVYAPCSGNPLIETLEEAQAVCERNHQWHTNISSGPTALPHNLNTKQNGI